MIQEINFNRDQNFLKIGMSLLDNKTNDNNGYISGRNAVMEALKSGRAIDCILVARGERNGSVNAIIAKAKSLNIPIKDVSPVKLETLFPGGNHQGVAASAAVREYAEPEDIFKLAEERNEPPFIIIADGIEDAHNLGAILRTADAVGAHGIIIPKRHAVGLNYIVGKTSAGAVEYVPVARVTNIPSCIDDLKKRGVWIYGTDMDGECWCSVDMTGPSAIVIGSEGKGISRLVREKCDFLISLPMKGKVNCLNASVAAGVVLYEAARQRSGLKAK